MALARIQSGHVHHTSAHDCADGDDSTENTPAGMDAAPDPDAAGDARRRWARFLGEDHGARVAFGHYALHVEAEPDTGRAILRFRVPAGESPTPLELMHFSAALSNPLFAPWDFALEDAGGTPLLSDRPGAE